MRRAHMIKFRIGGNCGERRLYTQFERDLAEACYSNGFSDSAGDICCYGFCFVEFDSTSGLRRQTDYSE
jgi:hypothetical protein